MVGALAVGLMVVVLVIAVLSLVLASSTVLAKIVERVRRSGD